MWLLTSGTAFDRNVSIPWHLGDDMSRVVHVWGEGGEINKSLTTVADLRFAAFRDHHIPDIEVQGYATSAVNIPGPAAQIATMLRIDAPKQLLMSDGSIQTYCIPKNKQESRTLLRSGLRKDKIGKPS